MKTYSSVDNKKLKIVHKRLFSSEKKPAATFTLNAIKHNNKKPIVALPQIDSSKKTSLRSRTPILLSKETRKHYQMSTECSKGNHKRMQKTKSYKIICRAKDKAEPSKSKTLNDLNDEEEDTLSEISNVSLHTKSISISSDGDSIDI